MNIRRTGFYTKARIGNILNGNIAAGQGTAADKQGMDIAHMVLGMSVDHNILQVHFAAVHAHIVTDRGTHGGIAQFDGTAMVADIIMVVFRGQAVKADLTPGLVDGILAAIGNGDLAATNHCCVTVHTQTAEFAVGDFYILGLDGAAGGVDRMVSAVGIRQVAQNIHIFQSQGTCGDLGIVGAGFQQLTVGDA